MYRDRDVIAKGEVVEHIDSEEHQRTQKQSGHRDTTPLKERWWIAEGEVSRPCDESCHNELNEGDEKTFRNCQVTSTGSEANFDIPLSGSHLVTP